MLLDYSLVVSRLKVKMRKILFKFNNRFLFIEIVQRGGEID